MPITFACGCGKTLRVKDEHAGKWVRCPACKETAMVPEAAPEPEFEVVEDDPPPPPRPARVRAEAAAIKLDDEEPPPRPRSRPDQEYDGPKKKKKSKRAKPAADEKPDHFALERGVLDSGMIGGLAAMVIAVAWFFIGRDQGVTFLYPPVLFAVGLLGFLRGLVNAGR